MWYSLHPLRSDRPVLSRMVEDVLYDKLDEYIALQKRQIAVAKERDWQACTFWLARTGPINRFVQDAWYPDLPSYEEESEAALKDAEFAELERLEGRLIVPGSARLDLLQQVEALSEPW
jgi:hypothetical protein